MLLTAIILASVFALISSIQWARRFNFLPFSPAGVYAIIWGLIWTVHLLGVLDYLPLTDQAVTYSIISLLGIFTGEQIGLMWNKPRWRGEAINIKRLCSLIILNNVLILIIAFITFVSVYLLFGAPWQFGVGHSIKMERIASGTSMFGGSPYFGILEYITLLRGLIYFSVALAIPLFVIKPKLSIFCFISAFVAGTINDLCWGSRTLILDQGFFLITAFILLWNSIKREKIEFIDLKKTLIILSMIIALSGLLFVGQIITTSTRMANYKQIGGMTLPYGIAQVIDYYTSPIVSFDLTLDDNPTTYGFMSFGGILDWMYMLRIFRVDNFYIYGIMETWEMQNPMHSYSGDRGNVYSCLRYFYSDFGFLGLFIFPFFTGFLSAVFAERSIPKSIDGFFNTCWLSYCYYIVFRSPQGFPMRNGYIILSIILIMLLKHYVKVRLKHSQIRTVE